MELLGDTLPLIAREKGGILKRGSPAWSVPQPEDAWEALQVGLEGRSGQLLVCPRHARMCKWVCALGTSACARATVFQA